MPIIVLSLVSCEIKKSQQKTESVAYQNKVDSLSISSFGEQRLSIYDIQGETELLEIIPVQGTNKPIIRQLKTKFDIALKDSSILIKRDSGNLRSRYIIDRKTKQEKAYNSDIPIHSISIYSISILLLIAFIIIAWKWIL